MANPNHASDKQVNQHVKTGGTEGGSCLTRHISGVSRSSCSHRWQARERAANEDRTWYAFPAYSSLVRRGTTTAGAWDPSIPANFARNCRTPYWHQSHHLIPNAVLNDCIAAEGRKDPAIDITRLIRQGLLAARYNLNHKKNMLILPMEKDISISMKLPKHLQNGARSHDGYSTIVATQIKSVIADYAEVVKKGNEPEKHPPPPGMLSRAKLERVSRSLRIMVRQWGYIAPGKALEEHA